MDTTQDSEAVLSIALMAALADGRTGADERDQIKSVYESIARDEQTPALASLHQRVVLKQTSLEAEAHRLGSVETKRMAFEIAVCVADADGRTTDAEQAFLDTLERALGLDHEQAVAFERDAESIALADPTEGDGAIELAPAPIAMPAPAQAPAPASEPQADPRSKECDRIVLQYAILNGALELLPQNLATMAILPLQTRMVYAVGKQYGHTLGAAHIKEFIATLGLGATSQMLENFARKAIGKLVKKQLGKTAGKIAKTATGPMMTFASTYAIGQVAKRYYAGGRTLSALDLRGLFQNEVARGRTLYETHRPQIEQNAGTLDPAKVLRLVRGGVPA